MSMLRYFEVPAKPQCMDCNATETCIMCATGGCATSISSARPNASVRKCAVVCGGR